MEYDQELSKAHTADQPEASWGRATEHHYMYKITKYQEDN